MNGEVKNVQPILETIPFSVEQINFTDETLHPYYRLDCPDWVNILPITIDNQALLIRQKRAGTLRDVLETPGGVVERDEKDTTMAAARELEEETGFATQKILPIGCINPNPAIMTNRLHMFVGLGCAPAGNRQHFADEREVIEVVPVPVHDLDTMVRSGQIDHCLSALTIMLAAKYVKIGD